MIYSYEEDHYIFVGGHGINDTQGSILLWCLKKKKTFNR